MVKAPAGNPLTHPMEWARRCRIEAARAIHPSTKSFLLILATEFEELAGEAVNLDPAIPIFKTRSETGSPNSPRERGIGRARRDFRFPAFLPRRSVNYRPNGDLSGLGLADARLRLQPARLLLQFLRNDEKQPFTSASRALVAKVAATLARARSSLVSSMTAQTVEEQFVADQ